LCRRGVFFSPLVRSTGDGLTVAELFHDIVLANDTILFIGRESPGLLRNEALFTLEFSNLGVDDIVALQVPVGRQQLTGVERRSASDEQNFVWHYHAPWLSNFHQKVTVTLRNALNNDAGNGTLGGREAAFEETILLPQKAPPKSASPSKYLGICALVSMNELHLIQTWSAYHILHGVNSFYFYLKGMSLLDLHKRRRMSLICPQTSPFLRGTLMRARADLSLGGLGLKALDGARSSCR